MNEQTQLVTIEQNIPLTDSRNVAQELGIGHGDFFTNVITKYQAEMEEDFGIIRFQNGKPSAGSKGGRPVQYALLTEDQTYAYLAYSKNTEQARTCKRMLIKAFAQARAKMQMLEANLTIQLFPTPILHMHQALAEWVQAVKEEGYTEETDLLFDGWRQACSRITTEDQQQWDRAVHSLLTQQRVLLPALPIPQEQTIE